MLKKFAVVVLAVAMLMSYMGLASAAVFPDTAGHKQEAAIDRLTALGLLKGYEDGTFKPDAPINRAEFATVIVRALGLEAAAQMMAGTPTVFSDVYVGHWATGYINVAASQGIVNGYPDGTFKPEANVTYAEALKMILCALGYTPETFRNIVWPTTWIAKAIELGLTDGVALAGSAAGLPANRADVARMVDNALDVPKLVQVGYGDQTQYVVSGTVENVPEQTLLQNNLNMTKVVGVVEDAGVLLDSDLDLDVIEVKEGDKTNKYTVTDRTANIRAMVGLEITAWANSDGEIFLVTDVDDGAVKSAYVPKVVADAVYQVQLGKPDDYKQYPIATDATILYNHAHVTASWLASNLPSNSADYCKANYIVKDGKVTYLDIVNYSQPCLVDEVNTRYEKVLTKAGSTITYKGKDVFVTRDGKSVAITDLKENDVAYAWSSPGGDKMYVAAFSGSAVGEFESASSGWGTLTVGGKSYSAIPSPWVSGDKGESFQLDDETTLGDLLGTEVTLYLGFDGKVVAVAGEPEAAAAKGAYGLVYAVRPEDPDDPLTPKIGTLYLLTPSGSKVDYVVTTDTKIDSQAKRTAAELVGLVEDPDNRIATAGLDVGVTANAVYLIQYGLTDDGTKFDWIKVADMGVTPHVITGVDDEPDLVIYSGGRAAVKSDTVIVSITTDPDDVSDVPWSRIEGLAGKTLTGPSTVFVGDDVAKVVVLVDAPLVATGDVGIVTGNVQVSGGWRLTVDIGGTTKSFTVDPADVSGTVYAKSNWGTQSTTVADWVYLKAGNVVRIDVDASGELEGVNEWPAMFASATLPGSSVPNYVYSGVAEVIGVNATYLKLSIKYEQGDDTRRNEGATVYAEDDVIVYDCTGSTPVLADFASIRPGDTVQLLDDPLDNDDLIDVVKIVLENEQASYKIMGD